MNEKEKRIKDQRTIEATKKGFMGLGGKFGLILKNLGQPIVSQGLGFDTRFLDDPWALPVEEEAATPEALQERIPYFYFEDGEEPIGDGWRESRNTNATPYEAHEIGFAFDGLSRGMHLEIKYMVDNNDISVYYQGYMVYHEVAGELNAYAPNKEWEEKVEILYKTALKEEKKKNKQIKEDRKAMAEETKEKWWQTIKRRWGL